MARTADQYSSILEQGRRQFLSPRLEATCNFLEELQAEKGGWPRYRDGPVSLHHTSLVVSALDATDHERFSVAIAQAALSWRSLVAECSEELNLGDLVDFFRILRADRESADQLVERLAQRLRDLVHDQLHQISRVNVREFSSAIAALKFADPGSTEMLSTCIDRLLPFENTERGGWPGAPNGEPSLLATTDVIQTLIALDPEKYIDPIRRGARHLNIAISDRGWQSIASNFGPFVQASMLRALGSCLALGNLETGFELDTGIAALEDAANPDGGWGPGANQPSSIEITSTCLEALVVCGETRFVPYRMASSVVAEASHRASTLERELAKTQQEVDDRVSRQSKQILEDRNSLRKENGRLKAQINSLQLESQEAQRTALDEARRTRTLEAHLSRRDFYLDSPTMSPALRLADALGPILIALFAAVLFALLSSTDLGKVSTIVQILVVMIASLATVLTTVKFFNLREAQRARSFSKSLGDYPMSGLAGSSVSSTVLEFADIASELPPSLREELTYLLASRVIDMPPVVGRSYIEDAIRKFDFPRLIHARLLHWTTVFLELEPFSRRAVIEQIRRSTLLS